MRSHLLLAPAAAVAALALVSPLAAVPTGDTGGSGARPAVSDQGCRPVGAPRGEEPLCNPHLADSPWPGNHRNSYAQASSPFVGPTGPAEPSDAELEAVEDPFAKDEGIFGPEEPTDPLPGLDDPGAGPPPGAGEVEGKDDFEEAPPEPESELPGLDGGQ